MIAKLTSEEERFARELLTWDARRRPMEWMLSNLALVLAAVVILATLVFTLRHLTDRLILLLTVPGFVLGLLFAGIYYFNGKRIKERHRMAALLKALGF